MTSSPFTAIDEQSQTTCEKCGYTYDFFEVCQCQDSNPTIQGKKIRTTEEPKQAPAVIVKKPDDLKLF